MSELTFIEVMNKIDTLRIIGDRNVRVAGISCRSGDIEPGYIFAAIPGAKTDGHKFIPQAIKSGAKGLIVSTEPKVVPSGVAVAVVENPRKALALASAKYYGEPSKKMSLVAMTGTNGKTTTTYIIEEIFLAAGMKPAILGTVNYRFGDKVYPADVTTPESMDVQRMLSEMVREGANCGAMEVSSHALEQGRVWGLRFAARGFSNLSRDHLDYHGTMDAYFEAKAKLFHDPIFADSGPAAINVDDEYGAKLLDIAGKTAVPYGIDTKLANAMRPTRWNMSIDGLSCEIASAKNTYRIESRLTGRANLYNILCAMTLAEIVGVDPRAIEKGIANLKRVPGRLDTVDAGRSILVAVDYAHTPDALEKVLTTARELTKGRLIAVFGCGGDRDRGKRPIMGRIATDIADIAVVTSDNPRTEDPSFIISEILNGVSGTKSDSVAALKNGGKGYIVEADRRKAIFDAIELAEAGDAVIIAGKGHEDYQILGATKIHFDDREVASEALKKFGKDRGN